MLHQIDAVPALALGENALQSLPETAEKRAEGAPILLICDAGLAETPLVSGLTEAFSARKTALETHVPAAREPSAASISAAAEAARGLKAGLIIGLGGGSALDIAKMTAVCAHPQGASDPMSYALGTRILDVSLPKILAPTTAGTGAEAASTCVFSAPDGRKTWAWGPAAKPSLAILDPVATATLPPHLTAWCALDAFVHAFEAATNRNAHAGVHPHAHAALRLVAAHLPKTLKNNEIEDRQALLLAAFHAGVAIDACSTALAHNLSHALAGLAPVHHGLATALAFEATLPWLVETPTPALRAAAAALDLPGPEALSRFLGRLMDQAGIERRLPKDFRSFAPEALRDEALRPEHAPMLAATARAASPEDLLAFSRTLLALA
ncbi:MAG: iron-containing alcohol dehydrogenase [Pseudomonadota bacterium]